MDFVTLESISGNVILLKLRPESDNCVSRTLLLVRARGSGIGTLFRAFSAMMG